MLKLPAEYREGPGLLGDLSNSLGDNASFFNYLGADFGCWKEQSVFNRSGL